MSTDEEIARQLLEIASNRFTEINRLKATIARLNKNVFELEEIINDNTAAIARLEAIIAKFPHTADGVPCVYGQKVYPLHPLDDGDDHGVITIAVQDAITGEYFVHGYSEFRAGLNYSTEEAATAAREVLKGGDDDKT